MLFDANFQDLFLTLRFRLMVQWRQARSTSPLAYEMYHYHVIGKMEDFLVAVWYALMHYLAHDALCTQVIKNVVTSLISHQTTSPSTCTVKRMTGQ